MNAQDYAELITKILSSFQYLENESHFPYQIEIPKSNPSFLKWKAKILLRDGLCLSVNETAIFDGDGMSERSFAYDLRNTSTGKLIWRIDNHSRRQTISSPCHVHANPEDEEQRIECFANSRKPDFPYAISCVRKFYEQEHQDWEVNPNE